MKYSLLLTSFLCASAIQSPGAANFRISEVYAGVSGNDGTADWIEVTNFGDMTGDTSTLFYDDSSADIDDAGQLDAFGLLPGASAVFLLEADPVDDSLLADSMTQFTSVWGSGILLGLTNGGGGLGNGGDAAFLLDASGNIIDSAEYDESLGGMLNTIDYSSSPALSEIGINGAYESAPYDDDEGNPVTLIGSPGTATIPEPSSILLGFLGFIGFATRRRR
jgi:hypothetical protein